MANMPNFLVIGAAKAGTGSLYQYLRKHPQVYMSPIKEPRFFSFEGKHPGFCGPLDQKMYRAITSLEHYQSLYEDVSDEVAVGEASHSYLYFSEQSSERIKRYIPKAKLIVVLRNPIDRAYSSFLYLHRQSREPYMDFLKAFNDGDRRAEQNWAPLWRYKDMGFYYKGLKLYYEKFETSQLKVYLYEDLKRDPTGLLQDLFNFLDIDPSYRPNLSVVFNKSGIPQNKFIHKVLDQRSPWMRFINKSPYIPKSYQTAIMETYNNNLKRPKLSGEVKQHLIDIYQKDILNLQELINRDLSSWLQ